MRIEIHSKESPNQYSNENLEYINDRDDSQLIVRIKKDDKIIGRGIVLDFYKKFKNKVDGTTYAFYESEGFSKKAVFTRKGLFVNNIKYKKSDLSDDELDEEFEKICQEIMNSRLFGIHQETSTLTCIPSATRIPQKIMYEIADNVDIKIANIISVNKNINSAKDIGINNYDGKLSYLEEKYMISNLENKRYIIIDDVFGTGYSMVYICNYIYEITGINPIFFCICKDVKR